MVDGSPILGSCTNQTSGAAHWELHASNRLIVAAASFTASGLKDQGR
jgi:hypothetical protein